MVSVIVPCYNQAEYLDECLQSVLDQAYQNWECIIINDGSPDDTMEIALKWCEKDDRFKYLYKENGGLSSARNSGIEIASGTFILPLDADDYISENYIEVCLRKIQESIDNKIVYGKAVKFGAKNEDWLLETFSFDNLLQKNMIFCTAMYRKSDWKMVGGYDTNMKEGREDWEFWINVLKRGGIALRVNDCTFYYRVKENSMIVNLSGNKEIKKKLEEYIFYKHHEVYTPYSYYELYQAQKKWALKLDQAKYSISVNDIMKVLISKIIRRIQLLFTVRIVNTK